MANVTTSLFPQFMGLLSGTPEESQAARVRAAYAPVDPMQGAAGIIRGRAEMMGQNIGRAFGQEPVQDVQKRKLQAIVQSAQQEADLATPEGLTKLAEKMNQFPEFSGIALSLRQQAAKQAQEGQLKQAQIGKYNAEAAKATMPGKPIQVDLGDRIEFRDPITNRVIETVKKGMTPAQAEKQAAAEAEQKPGFIGKTGAYRNQYGEVIPGSEMKANREGFAQGEKLMDTLNTISGSDVVNAESWLDYTEAGATKKALGSKLSPKTVQAQTKIAAAQLKKQIESLPKGSASDKDMAAAAKDFPGYGDAELLQNWINNTKRLLQASLERQADQYGFKQRVSSSGDISKGKKTTQTNKPTTRRTASGIEYTVEVE